MPESHVEVYLCFFLFFLIFGLYQAIDVLSHIFSALESIQSFVSAVIQILFIGIAVVLIKLEGSSFREHGFWMPEEPTRYLSLAIFFALIYAFVTIFLPGSFMGFEAFPAFPLSYILSETASSFLTGLAIGSIFLGYIQTNLTAVYHPFLSLCISSSMFALHKFPLSSLPELDPTFIFYDVSSLFAKGVFLGFFFQETKTLAGPIAFYITVLLIYNLTPLKVYTTGYVALLFNIIAYVFLSILVFFTTRKTSKIDARKA